MARNFQARSVSLNPFRRDARSGYESAVYSMLEDPVLKDVPTSPSVEDIDKLLAIEMGSAMKLTIKKLDGTSFEVAVLSSADVRDLKKAIEKVVDEKTAEELGQRSVSWSHVWGNFTLAFKGQRFLDDDAPLRKYDLRHNDTIEFVHHIRSKEAGEHSQAKKNRFFHSISTRLLPKSLTD